MKELIFLNVGGAGTRIGDKTWEVLSKEHELTSPANSAPPSPLFDNNAICCELPSGRFSPRNLFIDSSPEVVDEVRKGCRRQLYNPSSCITGKEDTANNYVRGHYTLGKNILEICEQKIVNMLQACDHFNGIVLNCSMSGGTGSGLTTLILDRIRYNNILNKKPVQVNMLMPSPRISDSIVEPYNFVMGLGDLIGNDCSKYVVGFDNEQLYRLCEMKGIDEPGYSEINGLMGQSISAMTHPFRLSTGSESMTELATNLIPYPFATLVSPTFSATSDITKIPNTVSSLYRPALCMNSYRVFGRESIFSSYGILRGEITHFEGVNALTKAKKQFKFCDWNLTNLKLKTCPFLPKQSSGDSMVEGVMLINSDSCRGTLDRIHKKYDLLYEKRSFIHWYVGEGIDDESITSCRQNTAVLDRDYEEMAVESVEDYEQIFQ